MNEILATLELRGPSISVEPEMLRQQLYNKRDNRDRLVGQMLDRSRSRKPRRRLGLGKRS